MRRFSSLLVVVPLVAVACGGSSGGSKTCAVDDDRVCGSGQGGHRGTCPGGRARQPEGALEPALEASQKRLGPTYAAFAAGSALVIERALKPFENRALTPFISQSVSQQFGLVAVRSGAKALAFPLRREGRAWKVETPGPIQFQILGPQPGSSGAVAQVAVEVQSPGVIGDAVLFVDGKPLQPNLTPKPGTATAFANLSKALPPGTHIAVVYAQEGNNAGAEAWSFSGDEAVAGSSDVLWDDQDDQRQPAECDDEEAHVLDGIGRS